MGYGTTEFCIAAENFRNKGISESPIHWIQGTFIFVEIVAASQTFPFFLTPVLTTVANLPVPVMSAPIPVLCPEWNSEDCLRQGMQRQDRLCILSFGTGLTGHCGSRLQDVRQSGWHCYAHVPQQPWAEVTDG